MVTEIGGASIASQIQSALRATETAPKPAATPVNAEPKAEAHGVGVHTIAALVVMYRRHMRQQHLIQFGAQQAPPGLLPGGGAPPSLPPLIAQPSSANI